MRRIVNLVTFLLGLAVAWKAAEAEDVLLTFVGIFVLGFGWTKLLALPGEGSNPRPRPLTQAEELERIDRDVQFGLEAVRLEFYARPLSPASTEELEREVALVLERGDRDFARRLAAGEGARHKLKLKDYIGGPPVAAQPKEVGVSPAAQRIRYSELEYRRALIVNGSDDAIAEAGYEAVRQADLVVTVKGNTFRVVKDRFGKVGTIEAAQLADIRTLDNVRIVQA